MATYGDISRLVEALQDYGEHSVRCMVDASCKSCGSRGWRYTDDYLAVQCDRCGATRECTCGFLDELIAASNTLSEISYSHFGATRHFAYRAECTNPRCSGACIGLGVDINKPEETHFVCPVCGSVSLALWGRSKDHDPIVVTPSSPEFADQNLERGING